MARLHLWIHDRPWIWLKQLTTLWLKRKSQVLLQMKATTDRRWLPQSNWKSNPAFSLDRNGGISYIQYSGGFMISSSAIITDKTQRNPLIFMQTGNVRHCPLTYRIILSRLNIWKALPIDGGYLRKLGKLIPLFLWTGMAGFHYGLKQLKHRSAEFHGPQDYLQDNGNHKSITSSHPKDLRKPWPLIGCTPRGKPPVE